MKIESNTTFQDVARNFDSGKSVLQSKDGQELLTSSFGTGRVDSSKISDKRSARAEARALIKDLVVSECGSEETADKIFRQVGVREDRITGTNIKGILGKLKELDKISEGAKPGRLAGALKSVKHRKTTVQEQVGLKIGIAPKFSGKSTREDRVGLIAAQRAESGEVVYAKHAAKGKPVKAARFLASNFMDAGTSALKARSVGKLKDSIEHLGYNPQIKDDMRQMANSLKGAFKSEAVKDGTIGTAKKAASTTVSVLLATPGAGDVAAAVAEGASDVVIDKLASMGTNKVAGKAIEGLSKMAPGGAEKLDVDGWERMLTDYLDEKKVGAAIVGWTKELVGCLHNAPGEQEALLTMALENPRAAAEEIYARQSGREDAAEFRELHEKAAQWATAQDEI